MESISFNNIEYLWALLERLNKEDKIELAARLMGSLRTNKNTPPNEEETPELLLERLAGAWSEIDENLADDIKEARSVSNLRENIFSAIHIRQPLYFFN